MKFILVVSCPVRPYQSLPVNVRRCVYPPPTRLPCVGRKESWSLSDVARCALRLATFPFGPLFRLDRRQDLVLIRSIGWSFTLLFRITYWLGSCGHCLVGTVMVPRLLYYTRLCLPYWLCVDPNISFHLYTNTDDYGRKWCRITSACFCP